MNEQWLSVAEAAKALGVSEQTVRRRAHQGKLRSRQGSSGRLQVRVKANTAPCDKQRAQNPWLQQYAPLPAAEVGTPIDPNEKPSGLPLARRPLSASSTSSSSATTATPIPLKPLGLSMLNCHANDEDDLTRFQRMAGASLMLAQNQVNEANEKLAIVRHELHRSRKVTRWAVAGATLAMVICLFTLAGRGGNAASVQAQASEAAVQAIHLQARQWQDELIVTRQELSAFQDKSESLQQQLTAARREAEQLNQRLMQLESESQQTPDTGNHTPTSRQNLPLEVKSARSLADPRDES